MTQPTPPVFVGEDQDPQKTYEFYRQYAKPSDTNYQTPLSTEDEEMFRAWVTQGNVAFDPDAKFVDYDMRGYWSAYAKGHPNWLVEQTEAGTVLQPGADHPGAEHPHFLDPRFETPYGPIFSRGSQYATPDNPFDWAHGEGTAFIDTRTGQTVFDYPPEDQAAIAAEPPAKLTGPGTGNDPFPPPSPPPAIQSSFQGSGPEPSGGGQGGLLARMAAREASAARRGRSVTWVRPDQFRSDVEAWARRNAHRITWAGRSR